MITFVTFFVKLTDEELQFIQKINPYFEEMDPDSTFSLLYQSAKKFHSECRFVILTDEKTEFALEGAEIRRYPIERLKVALSKLQAVSQFLENNNDNTHYVIMDTDMLIQKNLDPLFDGTFSIGLSYRLHPYPLNGGLTLISQGHREEGRIFTDDIIRLVEKKKESLHSWWGGQKALIEYFRLDRFVTRKSDLMTCKGIPFRFFPCETVNFTPDFENGLKEIPIPYIIHFKGKRKSFMPPYWEKYLQ